MLFYSKDFFIFLIPVLTLFYFLKKYDFKIFILIISSLIFYSYWKFEHLFLFIFSIIINYILSIYILKYDKNKKFKKYILASGIIINLLLIFIFKYFYFFFDILFAIYPISFSYSSIDIILPLAISFFTFQQISYLIDIYYEKIQKPSFKIYACYISFFPQLIAGPIVRFNEFNENLKFKLQNFDIYQILRGLFLFMIGIIKKIYIADYFAKYSDAFFMNGFLDNSLSNYLIGILSFYFQIYFDFSSYTDMALGIGLMFGFILPINFNSPYKQKSIIDFWRNWHISLSLFLRDYLYFFLGGSKKGLIRKYLNIFFVMLLCGLWHGAGLGFVLWGIYNGILLCINHFIKDYKLMNFLNLKYLIIPKIIILNIIVIIGWIIFRSTDLNQTSDILYNLFFNLRLTFSIHLEFIIYSVIAFVIIFALPNTNQIILFDKLNIFSKLKLWAEKK